MNEKRVEVLRRGALVALPLLVLIAVTIAWFIDLPSALFGEMSFASTSSGAGANISVGAVIQDERVYTETPETIANSVVWGEILPMEESSITIENLVPGQCVYYKFICARPAQVSILDLIQKDKDGVEVEEGNVPLADYLSIYLYPLEAVPGTVDPIPSPAEPMGEFFPLDEQTRITTALTRGDADTYLASALFYRGTWTHPLWDPDGTWGSAEWDPELLRKEYIMAVYCDTENHAPVAPGEDAPPHLSTLEGSLSLKLSFVAGED